MNVVGNAIKYCKTGYIEVSASIEEVDADNAKVRFSVKDTGIGLTEDELTKLFKPFSQANANIASKLKFLEVRTHILGTAAQVSASTSLARSST